MNERFTFVDSRKSRMARQKRCSAAFFTALQLSRLIGKDFRRQQRAFSSFIIFDFSMTSLPLPPPPWCAPTAAPRKVAKSHAPRQLNNRSSAKRAPCRHRRACAAKARWDTCLISLFSREGGRIDEVLPGHGIAGRLWWQACRHGARPGRASSSSLPTITTVGFKPGHLWGGWGKLGGAATVSGGFISAWSLGSVKLGVEWGQVESNHQNARILHYPPNLPGVIPLQVGVWEPVKVTPGKLGSNWSRRSSHHA